MGCDIHMFVEIHRHDRDFKDGWRDADNYQKDYWNTDKRVTELSRFEKVPIWDGRDYTLFSILAGVRNSNNIKPVKEPRGFPEDCNESIKNQYEEWGIDAHTPSWLTLKELKAYSNKHKTFPYSGLVDPEAARKLDEENIYPSTWCADTSDKTWVYREWQREQYSLGKLISNLEQRLEEYRYYFTFEERENNKHESKIRIVFWFDN